MSDYTDDVIAHHIKTKAFPVSSDLVCYEIHDWIDNDMCMFYEIKDELKPYVDFSRMLLRHDGSMRLYVRHNNTNTFQDITDWVADGQGGKNDTHIRPMIAMGKRNLLFVLM
jgi:hypothetical protein